MAIDDPIEALGKLLELENASNSDISRAMLTALELSPLPWPLSAAVSGLGTLIDNDRYDRLKIYVQTVATVMKALQKQYEQQHQQVNRRLDELEAAQRAASTLRLLTEGARRVSSTRSATRVERIGIILARGVMEEKTPDEDEIEEMMRTARELTELEIDYLRELVRIYGEVVKQKGRVDRYTAYQFWVKGRWGDRTNPEIDSACSKLESFGLVASIPGNNTLNVMADIQNRYVLLLKGLRFAELISEPD
ncbi:MAG TPA: hypothetical protein VGR47_19715 [Terracidiphilus sp.]|nr:hypothetical protein [Terracidiphilus sp.]